MVDWLFERFCIQNELKKFDGNHYKKEVLKIFGILPEALEWFSFLEVISLFFGGFLFASGMIFFIASNWENLGKFFKFFLVEGIILISILLWFKNQERLFGKISLMVAFILLGGLLALIGQVYQSDANSWELFFYWAMLGIFWVVAGYFEPLWILWIIVSNVAIFLFVNTSFHIFAINRLSLDIITLWNIILLAIFEILNLLKSYPTKILSRFLATIVIIAVSLGELDTIFSHHYPFYALYFIVLAGAIYYFLYKDIYIVLISVLSLNITILIMVARWLFRIRGIDYLLLFFFMSIFSIFLAFVTIEWLKTLRNSERIK
jgi:uncharacterized membrane protein